jgi:hypothetical protein
MTLTAVTRESSSRTAPWQADFVRRWIAGLSHLVKTGKDAGEMLFLPRIQVELPLHLNVRRPHDLRPFGEFRSTETEMGGAGSHEANRLGFDMLKSR